MKAGVTPLFLALLGCLPSSCLPSPASLGGAFADTYHAFAPLFTLHRAYADHVFLGAPVRPPAGLSEACAEVPPQLDLLRAGILLQTESARVEAAALLSRVREELGLFCQVHEEAISGMSALGEVDSPLLQAVAEEGLFARIGELETGLNDAFDETVSGFEPGGQWRFSVAFAVRTLLSQGAISRLDVALVEILLGSERAPPPPGDLPASLLADVQALAALCGRDLELTEGSQVKDLAARIEVALLEGA